MAKAKKKPAKKAASKKASAVKANSKKASAVKAKKKVVKKKAAKKVVPVKVKKKLAKKAAPKAIKKPAKKIAAKKTPKPATKAPSNDIIKILLKELEQEAKTTRKMLRLVPDDKSDWKPHEKSMAMQRLAVHIAELPTWVSMAINTDELNFEGNSYAPAVVNSNAELLELLEKSIADGAAALEKANDDILSNTWVMRSGDTIYSKSTKGEVIRMAYSQIVHHRAQLGVYLRLLDIPLPGSYGPSADDNSF